MRAFKKHISWAPTQNWIRNFVGRTPTLVFSNKALRWFHCAAKFENLVLERENEFEFDITLDLV